MNERNISTDEVNTSSSNIPLDKYKSTDEQLKQPDDWDVEWDIEDPEEDTQLTRVENINQVDNGNPDIITTRESFDIRPSPHHHGAQNQRKRIITAIVLMVLVLVSLVGQTEATVYVQRTLGWNKSYFILYLSHSSYILLYPSLLIYLRYKSPHQQWKIFWESHKDVVISTSQMVRYQTLQPTIYQKRRSPINYMIKVCFIQAFALNLAAVTWFFAANMTTPSDLTAINNTSALFTYVFSVWLLHEKPKLEKNIAVVVSILGVLIIAYGNPSSTTSPTTSDPNKSRTTGNIICALGAILFGLYRVLYKLKACLPSNSSEELNLIFANLIGSSIGFFTLLVFWIPIPFLHFLEIEKFEISGDGRVWIWMSFGMLCAVVFTGSFLGLIAVTGPVLGSVAALLSIFFVELFDWLFTGNELTAATLGGGVLIIIAFGLLCWSSYKESYDVDDGFSEDIVELERMVGSDESEDDEEVDERRD